MRGQAPAWDDPPRFITDMNFNWRIVAGLRRRASDLDLVTVQDIGLQRIPDPELLAEAQALNRILLTHDVNTMPKHFADYLSSLSGDQHSPGVMLVAQDLPVGVAIQVLYEVWACSGHEEWRDRFTYLPL